MKTEINPCANFDAMSFTQKKSCPLNKEMTSSNNFTEHVLRCFFKRCPHYED